MTSALLLAVVVSHGPNLLEETYRTVQGSGIAKNRSLVDDQDDKCQGLT